MLRIGCVTQAGKERFSQFECTVKLNANRKLSAKSSSDFTDLRFGAQLSSAQRMVQ